MEKGSEIVFRVAPKVGRRAQSCNSLSLPNQSPHSFLLLEKQGAGSEPRQGGA